MKQSLRLGWIAAAWFLIIFFCLGCGSLQCKIESNTSWSGAIGNSTKQGHGNEKFDISSGECACVQKETTSGILTVKITQTGGLFGDNIIDQGTTTADYGLVTVCDKSD